MKVVTMSKYFDPSNIRGDIMGGLTAGVVALPLALAFGEASGAGPIAGLWGAIFVGFFAALLGGTGSQISGPTGPMVVVFAGVFASLSGEPALVFAAVVLAGLLQIMMGVFRLGQYIKLVPYPVISGFMSGIGAIIIALQVARLFGHEPDAPGTIAAISAVPGAIFNPVWSAFVVGALSLFTVFFWPKKLGKYIPGALVALFIGTVVGMILNLPQEFTLGDIPTGLPQFALPNMTASAFNIVIKAAIILALLGAIDSLLTSLVADNMTATRHESNRELIGQGVGNTVAGLFGAIPGAGATMRTVVNIRSGGSTRISGMVHAIVLVIIAIPLASLASKIPHAVLAGILIKVGYDIIDWSYIRRAHRGPRWDLALMVLVLGLTVFVDLIQAVAAGVVLAALSFVKNIANIQLKAVQSKISDVVSAEEYKLLESTGDSVALFDFAGVPLSFGAATDLPHQLRDSITDNVKVIILDFKGVINIDLSSAYAIETVINDAREAGKTLLTTCMNDSVHHVLKSLDIGRGDHYPHKKDAIVAAVRVVKGSDEHIERDKKAS